MIQFSKTWCRFTIVSIILVLAFIAGIVGPLAQTTQDSVGDKNQSSSDTTKKDGFLGSGMSLLEIGLFLGGIGAFFGGIAAVVVIIRRKQPQIQLVLPTSAVSIVT